MIYLDHNATTPTRPEVVAAMEPFFHQHGGNPSSRCYASKVIRQSLEAAREQVATLIGARPEEVVFTSGGTESNATALRQFAGQVLTSVTEHSSIRENGANLIELPVSPDGDLDEEAWKNALDQPVAGVSLHLANNETGRILPIARLAAEAKVPFHTDAVQALGKIPVRVNEWKIDYASFSAHKIGGPKGVGALWIRGGAPFIPLFRGGGQQDGRRSGTENVPGIVGFGKACELAGSWSCATRDLFERLVAEGIPDAIFHGRGGERLPNTSSLRFPGIPSAEFLLMLDERGLCASAGSACNSRKDAPSHVMLAMGLSDADARGALRFSFGPEQDESVAREAAAIVIKMSRRYRG